jgi:hypothetical protein
MSGNTLRAWWICCAHELIDGDASPSQRTVNAPAERCHSIAIHRH